MSAPAPQWDEHWRDHSLSTRLNPAQALRRRLVFAMLDRPPGTATALLDIGCGIGDMLEALATRYPKAALAGVDNSQSGLDTARAALPAAILARFDLSVPVEEPGVLACWASHAVCSEVLEHADDPAALLTHAAVFLKPGGMLAVTVPGGPLSAFDRHLGHRRHFSKTDIRNVLESAGFEVLSVAAAGFPTFNLYKLVVMARGDSLIDDIGGKPSFAARAAMTLFRCLLPFHLPDSPWGWQITALAQKKA